MRSTRILAFGGLVLAGAALAQELPVGDPAHGETLIAKCRTCHGSDGISKLVVAPHIAGEPEGYLASQLVAFRDGTRQNEMMSVVVKDLSDQDIADLAAWYGTRKITATPVGDTSGAPELCVSCHGASGISDIEDAPHLAGDSAMYLEEQLKAFRSGARVSETMNAIAADLTDDDIKSAVAWYSSIRLSAE